MLKNIKRPFSPFIEKGEDVVILRFQPHGFTGKDWLKKKINSLLKRKPNAQKEMTQEVYAYLKQWFLGESSIGSHLFEGLNVFCVYEGTERRYIALNNIGRIQEIILPFRLRIWPRSKATFWFLESVERKSFKEVEGTYHDISVMCGVYFKKKVE